LTNHDIGPILRTRVGDLERALPPDHEENENMKWDCARSGERRLGAFTALAVVATAVGCSSSDGGSALGGATGGAVAVASGGSGNVPAAGGMPVTAGGAGGVVAAGGVPAGSTGGDLAGTGSTVGAGGTAAGGAAPTGGTGGSLLPSTPCDLHTNYGGDDRCIMPPPPDQGFQLHVGPSNYDNPEPDYVLQPGEEKTTDFTVTAPIDKDIYFYARQYRLRPSAHHVIISTTNGATGIEATVGRRIGTANTSQDFPANGVIPPEDQGVGIPLGAHSKVTFSFHTINTTGEPALREAWVNFYYRDASEVKEPATEWFETGSVTFAIPPHAKQTLGPYTCTVAGTGRMLWLYGHRHANNTRFQVTRIRGGQRDLIYDANNWQEPLLLEYSSTVKNPTADYSSKTEGGWSGVLDLLPGDKVEWACDINNTQDSTLRFTDQTYLGEMCIVDAEAVGATCQ
jgi:hypothetical protein